MIFIFFKWSFWWICWIWQLHLEVDGAVAVLVKDPEQLVQVLLTCRALAKISGLNKKDLNFFSSLLISLYLWHDGGKHDFHLFAVHPSIGTVLHEPLWIMYTVLKVKEGPRIQTNNFWTFSSPPWMHLWYLRYFDPYWLWCGNIMHFWVSF